MTTPGIPAAPEVTHSMGHYLMAVRDQLKEMGYARVTDIASRLNISRSSVSVALASLRDKGYLVEDNNHFFKLTDEGKNLAAQIYANHLLLETFFEKILGVSEDAALVDSCQIEHLLSPETSRKLYCLVHYFLDNQDQITTLRDNIEAYRLSCPHHDDCDLCKNEQSCPFMEIESYAKQTQ